MLFENGLRWFSKSAIGASTADDICCMFETPVQSFQARCPCVARYMYLLLLCFDSNTYFYYLGAEQTALLQRDMNILVVLFIRSLLLTMAVFRLTTAIPSLICHAPPGEAIDIRDCHELLGSIQWCFDGNANFLEQFLTHPWRPSWKTCSIEIALAHAPRPDQRVLRKVIYSGINHTLDQCVRDQGLGGVFTSNGLRVDVKRNSPARRHYSSHRRAGEGQ